MGFLLTALGFGAIALLAALSQQGAPAAAPAGTRTPPDPELLRQFLASNPTAEQIEAVARQLDAAGYAETAQTMRGIAQQRAERPAVPGEPLPPPPPPGTPQPESTAPQLPLRPGDDSRPEAAPTSPGGLTPAERAQLAILPPDVAAELTAYISSRPTDAPTRGAVLSAAASVARGGTTLSPAEREQSAALLASYGLTQTAAWLRSVPTATPVQAPPSGPPPGATPPQVPTAAPPTLQSPAGHAVRTAAYSETGARQLAPRVASDIKMRGRNYNREALAEFQRAAGIHADGVYGGETRGALVFYGVRDAPGALFRPTATVRYVPPPAA